MLQVVNEVKIKSYDSGLQICIYIYMYIYVYMHIYVNLISHSFLIVTFSIEKMPGMEGHTI